MATSFYHLHVEKYYNAKTPGVFRLEMPQIVLKCNGIAFDFEKTVERVKASDKTENLRNSGGGRGGGNVESGNLIFNLKRFPNVTVQISPKGKIQIFIPKKRGRNCSPLHILQELCGLLVSGEGVEIPELKELRGDFTLDPPVGDSKNSLIMFYKAVKTELEERLKKVNRILDALQNNRKTFVYFPPPIYEVNFMCEQIVFIGSWFKREKQELIEDDVKKRPTWILVGNGRGTRAYGRLILQQHGRSLYTFGILLPSGFLTDEKSRKGN